MVNDLTVEKLGVILNENPNGVTLFRDEIFSWLRTLDKEGHESSRGFYLESWNGTGRYTYDRIQRGTIDIEAAIVSIIGSIQPGRLAEYVKSAVSLQDGFTVRDVYRPGWSGLASKEEAQEAIELLIDLCWLRVESKLTGGKSKVVHQINPGIFSALPSDPTDKADKSPSDSSVSSSSGGGHEHLDDSGDERGWLSVNSKSLVQPLFEGPIDIVGDVHGGSCAGCALRRRSGCALRGKRIAILCPLSGESERI